MTKISVTGSKKYLEPVISELYEMRLLDIEDHESGELETGTPFEEAEDISQILVDIRSVLSKMPESKSSGSRISLENVEEKVDNVSDRMEEVNSRISSVEREKTSIDDIIKFFRKLEGADLNVEDLHGSGRLSVFVGELDLEEFASGAPNDKYEVFEGKEAEVVFYASKFEEEFSRLLNDTKQEEFSITETDAEGSIENVLDYLEKKSEELDSEEKEAERELEELASKWKGRLEATEEFLAERVEKAEAPIRFATTENTFIAKGWIPSGEFEELEEKLADVSDGRIHIQEEEGEDPPVKHENNRFVQPFESLTDLMAVPKYNELDPSAVIMLTFPLFFGFMIGDAGYGLTTLAVFYGGYRLFPEASEIFKSLMYASVATFLFGLAFGDAFGFIIFGSESVLTQLTGISLFQQIPILFHRAHHLGQVFTISALIGIVHINAGYLIGFYNEYVKHDFKEAFLEKGSWLMIEVAVALWYFLGAKAGAPVMAVAVILLYLGEGIEGVVEIPSLLSNMLSYLRIFGVSVAAVALAAVVNSMANPLFATGSLLGIALGVLVLIFGHTFNTFLKIMEGFLQGIRLHYVEMFSKFYEGGGRKYNPFGS